MTSASARVLLRDGPNREIALATQDYILTFRQNHSHTIGQQSSAYTSKESLASLSGVHSSNAGKAGSSTPTASAQRCKVELTSKKKKDLSSFRVVSGQCYGTLGLIITVENDLFLCVVSAASQAAVVRPWEKVQRILGVEFHCLNRPDYDHLPHETSNAYHNDSEDEDPLQQYPGQGRRDPVLEHPCLALKKLLGDGTFYYSSDFDLTRRLQDRSADSDDFDFDSFDRGYLWNSYMIKPLVDFRTRLTRSDRTALDATRLLTSAIRGYAATVQIFPKHNPLRVHHEKSASLTLISRLSCRRAGTRFNARGIDDDGAVANFVESETVLYDPSGVCFSYVQIRGSVPLFWEQQPGLLPGQQKIQISRSPQATQPAFDKHFKDLERKYGLIHVISLLSKEKSGEIELSRHYSKSIAQCSLNSRHDGEGPGEHSLLRETNYDFHAETRGPTGYEAALGIKRFIIDSADGFVYCYIGTTMDTTTQAEVKLRSSVFLQQEGVFRTNCLDCLDRTNLVQTIISQIALETFFHHKAVSMDSAFSASHGNLWADNGDFLSRIYAGTGALKSSFTRSGKMSLAGALADARKSATRVYINNFADKGRQNTIDMLLGRLLGQTPVYLYDPINDFVTTELSKRTSEFLSSRDICIWAGTLNLNGRANGLEHDLSPWLCPAVDYEQQNPHIVVVGFQEIVELSPQHIMSTNPAQRQAWEKKVEYTLNENARRVGSEEYVLLRGGQLVGASLSVFVKSSLLSHVKNVEGSLKKTGMSGMAGNKGAVAVRLDVDNTSFCFVTAHLAAGFANYEERNRDYKTIAEGLSFQRNRLIDDHQTIIWVGDFNYRIGLPNNEVRHLAKLQKIENLYEHDQLNLQMVHARAFPHYSEARIFFLPTYRYDVGTDEYDTSEKARTPAWCDRILYKGHNLRQIDYATALLRFSDHRPVYGTFTCTIDVIDEKKKAALSERLYGQHRRVNANDSITSSESTLLGDIDPDATTDEDDDLIRFPVAPGLPPPSSDKQKWWLEGGLPAKSTIEPPSADHIPNPERKSNPFKATDQPDWITKPNATTSNPASNVLKASNMVPQASRPNQSPLAKVTTTDPSLSQNLGRTTSKSNEIHRSVSASVPRKAVPPPIPKKPGHLADGSSNPDSRESQPQGIKAQISTARDPSLSSFSSRSLAQKSTTNQTPSQGALHDLLGNDQSSSAPALPPRRRMDTSSDLMDDEETSIDTALSGWAPLRPS